MKNVVAQTSNFAGSMISAVGEDNLNSPDSSSGLLAFAMDDRG